MLASPGQSPRHIVPPSPSPSTESQGYGALSTISTSDLVSGLASFPRKRKNSQVPLDEDTYVAAIEKIIERDFFPDIPKLRNRLEWLEAVRSGDPGTIRDAQMNIIRRRREKAREDGDRDGTPATNIPDTPASMISGLASPAISLRSGASPSVSGLFPPLNVDAARENENGPPVNTNMKLDDFLRKYTSEDNASFSKILEKVNKQRNQKYEFLNERGLVDPNSRIEHANDRVTDGFGTSNQPFATLETWKYRAKNLLMYDSAEREDAPFTQAEKEELVEGPPKAIAMRNTRFHGQMFDSKVREEDTVAILYTPVAGGTPQAWPFAQRDAERARKRYDLEDLRRTPQALLDGHQAKGAGHPGAGYSYVATPSPAPGVDESPFMTWGEIEGTPLRLETEDTPVGIGGNGDGPHFKIPAPPTRDARAHALSRDAARSLREKAKFHSPRFSPSPARGAGGASPIPGFSAAAQKFVNKAMAKSSSSVDARLRASYGASPGTPRLSRHAARSRSILSREGSLSLRSPSVQPSLP